MKRVCRGCGINLSMTGIEKLFSLKQSRTLKKAILAGSIACLMACHKEQNPVTVTPEPPAAHLLLVKDIVISNLPSPYYHFEYADSGKISRASFAGDFLITNLDYNKNLLIRSHNSGPANHDQLTFFYDSIQRPVRIDYVNDNGKTYKQIECTYDGLHLQSLKRTVEIANVFVTEKLMEFTYYQDGNLHRIEQHFPAIATTNQDSATFTDEFEAYDTTINPEGFSLLHDEFFDNLILLPGIDLQLHNPTKMKRSGDGLNYEVSYSFLYNEDHLPIIKDADILILNGSSMGQHVKSRTTYSYEPH
jgi:hypothetical protein